MQAKERFTDWRKLGQGGTAAVYRVHDNWLDCDMAIKVLLDQYATKPVFLETLKQEVKSSRTLRTHPNIAAIHEYYEGEMGVGIVMDIIESGMELLDWMKDNRGRLLDTASQRLELLRTLMDALGFAHKYFVHRDLKPQNIMLMNGDIGMPIIMDFGFAMPHADAEGAFRVGTPHYMSPEQYSTPDKVDARSDLFAMGIMAYELFTNRTPPTSLRRVGRRDAAPPRVAPEQITPPSAFCAVVPPSLDQLIISMMAFEPDERPQSARAVLETLNAIELIDEEDLRKEGHSLDHTVALPGGPAPLGSGPESSNPNEKPRRRVNLSPFRIDQYPVTNADYRQYLMSTGHEAPPFIDDSVFGRHNHPVVGVTWDEARDYARWLGGSLPSEAQWEFAAKAGGTAKYPWGDDPPSVTTANIDGSQQSTSAVGSFPSGRNAFELFDMCGNVWEWCEDEWDDNYYRSMKNGTEDPVREGDGPERSLRGGSFQSFASMGRSAFRFHATRDTRSPDIGFRVVYPVTGADDSGEDA